MLPLETNCLVCAAPMSDVSVVPDGRTIVQLYCGQCEDAATEGLVELEMGPPINAAGCQALVRILADPTPTRLKAMLALGPAYTRYVDEMFASRSWWLAHEEAVAAGREPPVFVGGRCPCPPGCHYPIAPPEMFAADRIGIFFTCVKHVNQSFLYHKDQLFLQTVYPLNCDERDAKFFEMLKSIKLAARQAGAPKIAAIPERTFDTLKLVLAWAKAEGLVQEQL